MSENESEWIGGLAVGWALSARGEAVAEFHQTSVRTTGENERFMDVGFREVLAGHVTLLASAGRSVGARIPAWIGYFGVQLTS